MVNEFLQQLEAFDQGVFIATTNLMDRLDEASLRRFDAKVTFSYLQRAQATTLMLRACERLGLDPHGCETLVGGLDRLTPGDFAAVMRTNVMAPMRLAPALAPALARAKGKLAVTSSRMGSIGARNAVAGWLYRASKAALNSVLKDMSLVLGPQGITCVTFHPGWVRTDMGGAGADIPVSESVSGMRRTLAALTPAQNGSFLNYDGSPIPW